MFNSRRDDYSPMLAGDADDQLFFTSTRNQAQGDELSGITGTKSADIFYSQKDEKGKWGKPQVIATELNSAYDEGACCFSPDGKTMYLTQCATDPDYPRYARIMVSTRSDASWSKPKELVIAHDNQKIKGIEGGKYNKVADNLYLIECNAERVEIELDK